MTGKPPFYPILNDAIIITKLYTGDRPERPTSCDHGGLSDALWRLTEICWSDDLAERPAISDVLLDLEAISTERA